MASPEDSRLLETWRSETDRQRKEELFDQIIRAGLFPSDVIHTWESSTGLYPAQDDIDFLPKLLRKREFLESYQNPLYESWEERSQKCRTTEEFELTPVQRFVNTFLSPRTPYTSALLYHGVGVGKTCTAITICESYLERTSRKKAYIIAPPNIQEGFLRTIFDFSALRIGTEPGVENTHRGCTGDIYLKLTNNMFTRDEGVIRRDILRLIGTRYAFFGYYAFYKEIERIKESIPKGSPTRIQDQRNALREEFSNRIIILDEAHNLRDNPDEKEEESADDASILDTKESQAGKKLTPYFLEVLRYSEGITLVLMTATPMYNSYKEIIFLLRILQTNDKVPLIQASDVFEESRDGVRFTPQGKKLLGGLAGRYISFMRGENPMTFPVRLSPLTKQRVRTWPSKSPKGELAPPTGRQVMNLPCVGCYFTPESETFYKNACNEIVQTSEGLSITSMDRLIQGGNWMFPVSANASYLERIQQLGFESVFSKEKKGSLVQYRDVEEDRNARWLLEGELPKVSAKASFLLKRMKTSKGVVFIYSRFVATGALSIALALEANGYTAWGRDVGLLANGNQHPEGKQCAYCEKHERGHGTEHAFKAAKYILLTGQEELSPNNKAAIDAARNAKNTDGGEVKVVLGSQVAGEGLDLRFIREIYVFDSWYHLNKLEQVVGRGVRNCSHALLPEAKRNTTLYLLLNAYASEPTLETVDQYSYRTAFLKSLLVGQVSRVLKQYAVDCVLNHNAVLIEKLLPVTVEDGQGIVRNNVNLNDVPFTALCDWLGTCEYQCMRIKNGESVPMELETDVEKIDTSTYDAYSASHKIREIQKEIIDTIVQQEQVAIPIDHFERKFQTIPRPFLLSMLQELTTKQQMHITSAAGPGRILLKNQMIVFQPDIYKDMTIPIALRMLPIPVPRDVYTMNFYTPGVYELLEEKKENAIQENVGKNLWIHVKEWAELLRNGSFGFVSLPQDIRSDMIELGGSATKRKEREERVEMILWVYESLRRDERGRSILADVVLDYFWDEILTMSLKRKYLTEETTDPLIQKVARESYWPFEGSTYLRLHDTVTGGTEYYTMGPDGKVSKSVLSVKEVLERESTRDPLQQKKIDDRTTGHRYGFLVNRKDNELVFKTTNPPAQGTTKLGKGSVCASSSAVTYELNHLQQLGQLLRNSNLPDIGLNATEMARRRIQNSNRVCTLSNLVFRWMDHAKVQGRRWFYRPLEAKLLGHT